MNARLARTRRRGATVVLIVEAAIRLPTRPSAALEAHAWVECHGAVIVGQLDDLDEYVVLAAPNW
jgi:hypothetical protein